MNPHAEHYQPEPSGWRNPPGARAIDRGAEARATRASAARDARFDRGDGRIRIGLAVDTFGALALREAPQPPFPYISPREEEIVRARELDNRAQMFEEAAYVRAADDPQGLSGDPDLYQAAAATADAQAFLLRRPNGVPFGFAEAERVYELRRRADRFAR